MLKIEVRPVKFGDYHAWNYYISGEEYIGTAVMSRESWRFYGSDYKEEREQSQELAKTKCVPEILLRLYVHLNSFDLPDNWQWDIAFDRQEDIPFEIREEL